MKRLILFMTLFIVLVVVGQAQVLVNGKNINNMNLEYIELIVDRRAFNQGQVYAVIDYGQTIRNLSFRQNRIHDDKGQDRLFGGEMDIFNFLFINGWIHETTYAREEYVYHIFRRKN